MTTAAHAEANKAAEDAETAADAAYHAWCCAGITEADDAYAAYIVTRHLSERAWEAADALRKRTP